MPVGHLGTDMTISRVKDGFMHTTSPAFPKDCVVLSHQPQERPTFSELGQYYDLVFGGWTQMQGWRREWRAAAAAADGGRNTDLCT